MLRRITGLAALLLCVHGLSAAPLTIRETVYYIAVPPGTQPVEIQASLDVGVGRARHEGGSVWYEVDREFSRSLDARMSLVERNGEPNLKIEVGAGSLETLRRRDVRDGLKLCDASFNLDLKLERHGHSYEVRLTWGAGVSSSMNGERWNGTASDAKWLLKDGDLAPSAQLMISGLCFDFTFLQMMHRQIPNIGGEFQFQFFTHPWYQDGVEVTPQNRSEIEEASDDDFYHPGAVG